MMPEMRRGERIKKKRNKGIKEYRKGDAEKGDEEKGKKGRVQRGKENDGATAHRFLDCQRWLLHSGGLRYPYPQYHHRKV